MNRAVTYLEALQHLIAPEEVGLSGAWASKSQRRYESEEQSGTGEGPYIDVIDWRWEGAFESDTPIACFAFLSVGDSFYWAKSQPPKARAGVSFSAHGWAARPSCVSVTGSAHGAFLPSVPVEIREEPPTSCVIGQAAAPTGTPHIVAQIAGVIFGVVPLPGSAVKVGRNRLWHLRESIASQLPPPLNRIMTRARSGRVNLADLTAADPQTAWRKVVEKLLVERDDDYAYLELLG